MAKQVVKKAKPGVSISDRKNIKITKRGVSWEFPLFRKNLIWILAGVGTVVLGYILMSTGITQDPALLDAKWNNPVAIYIAPVLLVIGYCVLIPYGILKLFPKKTQDN